MHRFFVGLSRLMAALGGLVLSGLILLMCLSVVGRTLNTVLHAAAVQALMPGFADWALSTGIGPIEGDFELVEAGIAFSIFAFMPYCHITLGHASVDIFTSWFSERAQKIQGVLIEMLFAVVLVVIAVQLEAGMQSKMRSGQTTFLLQFPIWWAYALSFFGAAVAAIVGIYMAIVRVVELASGKTLIGDAIGDDIEQS
ncbi:hypothetical protein MesoLjLc_01170 [Mesorhizobium sp. L-8-10]|uniref:TRAP transporter small permease n=1 Tax=unclassified Mesorhizobium TaxID=325217 RepID=UPI0019284276|nr:MULTISPECIES: TRAP transporter small permease [unclassified Mesorhizobium]BCH20333.1 hypothetical protein MesoLjLb_01180 [Mesorhizobium sp. L-8-3]BCH28187.1 hypothetical protein MesoLjLc_01170 [Mesorhizobium sp. L-8-10]